MKKFRDYCERNLCKFFSKQTKRIMKLTLFLSILTISQLWATEMYSQMTKLTLKLEDVKISDALKEIENQSEFFFLYSPKLIDVERKVNITADKEPIKDILSDIFGENVKFAVYDRQVIITPSDIKIPSTVMQQPKITGKVTGKDGTPMPGVNVVVTGTIQGTTTDVAGKYSIEVPTGSKSLTFSFIGMESQTISIGILTQINVTMAVSEIGLEEVVVIGYGTVKKSDVTGSISSLTVDNLSGGMVTAPQQAMQGKISGVNITLNSGEPGANSSVRIRGGTSINASNSPLYVIDGVPVAFDESSFQTASSRQTRSANNPLNMINVADIKSIDILKDASATAIYGSRGANGVIIITTKEGIAGRSKISYDTYLGVSKIRKKLDMLTGEEFRSYINTQPAIKNWTDGGTETDWQDQIFRTAITHSHSLALSGGDSKTNYRASVNYSNQQGIIIKSALQRMVARININHTAFNDRLTLKLFLSGAMLNNNTGVNPESTGGQYDGGIIRDALIQDPTYPVKDENGNYTWRGVLNQNPVEQANTLKDITETFRNLGNFTLDFKLTNSLTFNTNIGFTKEYVDRYFHAPKSSRVGADYKGLASHLIRNNYSKLLETNLFFKKIIKQKHDINAVLGYSFQEYFYTGAYNYATNFISDAISYNNLGSGLNQYPVESSKNSNRLISFYARATYGFDNKYLLTATVRQDGSSRFGANNKWAIFPSMAIAWKLTEEEFLKDNNVLSNLKLRAGYGVTGNQGIGNYLSLPTLSAGGYYYIIGGTAYVAVGPDQNYNPDLKWESTGQMNIGLDFGILNDRISGSIDFYSKKTKDLLLRFDVPSPAEVSTKMANVGGVENKGVEFELQGVVLSKENVNWEIYANLTHNSQKVTSLSNDEWKVTEIYTGSSRAAGFNVSTQIIRPGEPLGTFWGYKYEGVDENGVQKFKDLNNDGKILPGTDRMIIGCSQPDLLYGIGSKINYRALSFDFFFRGISGNQILNSTAMFTQNISGLPGWNVPKEALDDGVKYGEGNKYSSEWIQDASFLRLENATLGYNVNLKSTKLFSKVYLYITGQNLFVLTKYTGFDPEVSDGVDFMTYPNPRTYMMGLSVEF